MKLKLLLLLVVMIHWQNAMAQVINDNCANAIALSSSASCVTTTGTLLNAQTSSVPSSCPGFYEVYYKFVATSSNITVTVTPSSGLDAKIAVFTSCAASTHVTCVDGGWAGATEEAPMSGLSVGSTYYIAVSNYSASITTYTFNICVVGSGPANDECSSAITLPTSTVCSATSGSVQSATTTTTPSACSGNSDVFYKFIANNTAASITVTASLGFDPVVGVFTSCSASSAIACVDNGGLGSTETVNLTGLTIGSTYYIKVSDFSSSLPSTFPFTICVVSTPANTNPPANDNCANATTLSPTALCNPTSGTVEYAQTSATPASCSGNSDVYYKFVANNTTASITVNPSSGLDPVVGVLSSCAATSSLYCIDEQGDGGSESFELTGLTNGATYYIKVSDFSSSLPTSYTFDICVQSSPVAPNPPANDHCADAILITPSSSCVNTSGTLLAATTSTSNTSDDCAGNNSDVYYKFVANNTTATISVDASDGIDGVIGVYSSCSSASLACIDNSFSVGGG